MDLFQTKTMLPNPAHFDCDWLTWVGSAAGCLKALGCDVDHTEVAGGTGYAFSMVVHKELCPSGPTCLDWGALNWGVTMLGRSANSFITGDCHTPQLACERTKAHCREAFEIAAREILAGRPCVLWGAYVPEFAIVNGIDNGKYILSSFKEHCKEEQPPLNWDEINAPGGPYILSFPTATRNISAAAGTGHYTIARGIQLLVQPSTIQGYETGLKAYDLWCQALKEKRADGFGNSYNAQCYAVAKQYSCDYVKRTATRNPAVAEQLNRAAAHYSKVAQAMQDVAKLFPFPGTGKVEDGAVIKAAVAGLETAKREEQAAVVVLQDALSNSWSTAAAGA